MALSSTQMFAHTFNIGTGELMVILLVGLLVFGPKKLPEVARKVGKGLQQMRKTANAFRNEMRDAMAVPAEEVGVEENAGENSGANATADKMAHQLAGKAAEADASGKLLSAEPKDISG